MREAHVFLSVNSIALFEALLALGYSEALEEAHLSREVVAESVRQVNYSSFSERSRAVDIRVGVRRKLEALAAECPRDALMAIISQQRSIGKAA